MSLRDSQRCLKAGQSALRGSGMGWRVIWRVIRVGQRSLKAGQSNEGPTDVQTDGISPHSMGLRPLPGPLPTKRKKKSTKTNGN